MDWFPRRDAFGILTLVLLITPLSVSTQEGIEPPDWTEEDQWNSMTVILEEQRTQILEGPPDIVGEAAEHLWRAHHMSGLVVLPTPDVPATGTEHSMHVAELQQSIKVLEQGINRKRT